MIDTDVAIVGAGPAGLAAAIEAARLGKSVAVVDEYGQAGGQYYRQPSRGLTPRSGRLDLHAASEGRDWMDQATQAGARFLSDTTVWGVTPDGGLAVYAGGQVEKIKARSIVLASGANERSFPFPGWTLPGVMTAGAAQTLLKGHGVLPGRRILFAGTGPLQLAAAALLAAAGAQVVGVLEARRPGSFLSMAPRMIGQTERVGEAFRYWNTLRSAGVPLMFGRTVIRAEGAGALSSVRVAEIDEEWHPITGTESEIAADTLCLGFGLVPNTRLARLMGCQVTYDVHQDAYVPVIDESMGTSRPGVFVAGDSVGIAGAKAALLQGRLAGIAAAIHAGAAASEATSARSEDARRKLAGELRFATALNATFAIGRGALDLITEDTVICRCEGVTLGDLRQARQPWVTNLDAAKIVSRVGMGNCQGIVCEGVVAQLLARETAQDLQTMGQFRLHPPLKPVPLTAVEAAFDM
jgi:NADPH-dependent 2,4-dienoyl-CoA reductase/sulfur reductase-like enzyme